MIWFYEQRAYYIWFPGIVDQEKKYAEKVKCASAVLPFPEPNFKHKLVKWYED